MALSVFALGAPIGAWLAAAVAGAVAQRLRVAGGVLRPRRAGGTPRPALPPHHSRAQARAARRGGCRGEGGLRRGAQLSLASAGGVPRHHGSRCLLAVGLGARLVDPDLPAADLWAQRRRGRRADRSHPSHRRHCGLARRCLAHVPPVHDRAAARAAGTRTRHRLRHHPLDRRLLDALAVARPGDVLDIHPRHLLLHRPLHGAGGEPGAEPHARDLHRLVGPRGQRIQSDRRRAGRSAS